MILDQQLQFDLNVALTATAASTNYIDLSQARQIGQGVQLGVLITVSVGADHTTGDETYEFKLQTDSSSGFGSAVTIIDAIIPAAQLTTGAKIFLPIPEGLGLFKEFIRMDYVLGGTTPTITFSAELQPQSMVDEYTYYPSGYTISGH